MFTHPLLSRPGTLWLKHSSSPSRHCLLVDLSAAQSAAKGAVVEGTNANQVHAWLRFNHYLASIGLQGDPFLDNFSSSKQTKILSNFAHDIRDGQFCDEKHYKSIKSESFYSALDYI
jgi:hypothetical protein